MNKIDLAKNRKVFLCVGLAATATSAMMADTATACEKKNDPKAVVIATASAASESEAISASATAYEKKDDPKAVVITATGLASTFSSISYCFITSASTI